MRDRINKMLGWLLVSNRPAHLLCVGVMSLVLGWASGIASIVSLEYKDVQRGGCRTNRLYYWRSNPFRNIQALVKPY